MPWLPTSTSLAALSRLGQRGSLPHQIKPPSLWYHCRVLGTAPLSFLPRLRLKCQLVCPIERFYNLEPVEIPHLKPKPHWIISTPFTAQKLPHHIVFSKILWWELLSKFPAFAGLHDSYPLNHSEFLKRWLQRSPALAGNMHLCMYVRTNICNLCKWWWANSCIYIYICSTHTDIYIITYTWQVVGASVCLCVSVDWLPMRFKPWNRGCVTAIRCGTLHEVAPGTTGHLGWKVAYSHVCIHMINYVTLC